MSFKSVVNVLFYRHKLFSIGYMHGNEEISVVKLLFLTCQFKCYGVDLYLLW